MAASHVPEDSGQSPDPSLLESLLEPVEQGVVILEHSRKLVFANKCARGILAAATEEEIEDIIENETIRMEKDPSGHVRRMIMQHKGDYHPQIVLEDASGQIRDFYYLPEKAYIEVNAGDEVSAGTLLAKTPREASGTQDITGGLPRVTEIFEARKPKDPAVIAEIDGVVEILGEKRRGKRTIVVKSEAGMAGNIQMPDEQIDAYIPIEVAKERYGDIMTRNMAGTRMREMVELEEKILAYKDQALPDDLLIQAKKDGFADRYLSMLLNLPEKQIRDRRKAVGLHQAWESVPVSGVEDAAYYYSTYNAPDQVPVSDMML